MAAMDEQIQYTVTIGVYIEWDPETRRYDWKYEGPGVHPETGNFKLPSSGKTAIVYKLDEKCTDLYELVYVNLDPGSCATYQIEAVHVHYKKNAITIIDRNESGQTGVTPFSLRLVARMTGNIASGFTSSDPQVTNNPNSEPPPKGVRP
jgi:hypothetical protein